MGRRQTRHRVALGAAFAVIAGLLCVLGLARAEAAGRPGSVRGARNGHGHGPALRRVAHERTRAGRPGKRAPRRPVSARPRRAIPWLKGNLPNVQAQGAYVLDLASGEELFARTPDTERPIASISKLAAALAVVEKGLDLDRETTITRADAEVARGGARSRLTEGMTLKNRDLLHAALLGSDNRAVPALGRAVGLDASQLAAEMTARAQKLGLRHTRFVEPTGLSPANVSTPRESIELLRAVMDHPVLGGIVGRLEYDVQPVGRAPIRYLNTHRSASRSNTLVLGGKTGFNNAARYCLVLAARIAGRTIAMSFLATEGELTRFGDVARVADWVARAEPRPDAPAVMKPTLAAAAPGARPQAATGAGVLATQSAVPPMAVPDLDSPAPRSAAAPLLPLAPLAPAGVSAPPAPLVPLPLAPVSPAEPNEPPPAR